MPAVAYRVYDTGFCQNMPTVVESESPDQDKSMTSPDGIRGDVNGGMENGKCPFQNENIIEKGTTTDIVI